MTQFLFNFKPKKDLILKKIHFGKLGQGKSQQLYHAMLHRESPPSSFATYNFACLNKGIYAAHTKFSTSASNLFSSNCGMDKEGMYRM